MSYYVGFDILCMLNFSLIYPFLTHGILVWGLTCLTYLKPVITLQKHIVRIMTFPEPASHSEPLLKSLNLLEFSDTIHLEIISFVYQWSHKITPSCFTDYFKPISSVHSYYTRQSLNKNLFVNPVQTTQCGICSLRYTGASLWNSFPTNVNKSLPLLDFVKI